MTHQAITLCQLAANSPRMLETPPGQHPICYSRTLTFNMTLIPEIPAEVQSNKKRKIALTPTPSSGKQPRSPCICRSCGFHCTSTKTVDCLAHIMTSPDEQNTLQPPSTTVVHPMCYQYCFHASHAGQRVVVQQEHGNNTNTIKAHLASGSQEHASCDCATATEQTIQASKACTA